MVWPSSDITRFTFHICRCFILPTTIRLSWKLSSMWQQNLYMTAMGHRLRLNYSRLRQMRTLFCLKWFKLEIHFQPPCSKVILKEAARSSQVGSRFRSLRFCISKNFRKAKQSQIKLSTFISVTTKSNS
ncbi:hypothetical protein D3C87_1702360 [compost metagenome]